MQSKVLNLFGWAFVFLSVFEAGSSASDRQFGNMAVQLLLGLFVAAMFFVTWYQHHMELHEENEILHDRVTEDLGKMVEHFLSKPDVKSKKVPRSKATTQMAVDIAKEDKPKPGASMDGIKRK